MNKFLLSLFALAFLVGGAFATGINSCQNLTVTGTYTLTANVNSTNVNCFNIQADSVVLDCAGFTVNGTGLNAGSAYAVESSNAGTTIKNCHLDNYYFGVAINTANNIIQNNTFNSSIGSSTGIYMIGGSGNTIANNTFSVNFEGIFGYAHNNDVVTGNIINGNSSGFARYMEGSHGNNFTNNTINTSVKSYGFYALGATTHDNLFFGNNLTVQTGGAWIVSDNATNNFSNGTTGNTYYYPNGTGIWTSGNGSNLTIASPPGYSTSGYCVNSSTFGTYWNGSGNDCFAYTNNPINTTAVTINFPQNYTLYQRDTNTYGAMKICGNYSGSVTSVQYSTDGTTWNALNNTALASPFCYYQNANVGRFNLSIRVNGDSSSNKTIYNVSVGDLFLITGQSNAVGVGTGGNNTANASDPYAPVMFKSGVWQLATDPTSPAGGYGSPWMHFADNLTQQFSIPIGIINSAELGYQISNWNYNGLMTNITNGTLSNATNGTMRVKAVLFYQGETGLVPRYYENMTNMVSWMSSSFNVSASKVVYIGLTSPCGNYFGRDDNDLIRKAQLLVRTSNPLVGEGAVSYMINKNGSTLYDNCHFTTNASIRAHSDQWVREVLGQVYGVGDAIGAVPVSLVLSPTDNSSLTLTFNKAVQILNENYTPSTLAKGIRIDNGTANLTDANVISTTVSGASVVIVLNQNISNNSTMTYASYEDTNAKPVFMSLNNIPVMPFFNYPITAATLHPSGLSGMNLVLAGVLVMLYILLLAFFVLVLLDNFNLATLFAVLIAILIGFALLPSITNLI